MRVRGKGFGDASGFGGGGSADERGRRIRAFQHAHRVGQKVRGRLLAREGSLAKVRIDGQELLANIESAAAPGSELLFLVVRLVPDILLKEITGKAGSSLFVSQALSEFASGRRELEGRIARVDWTAAPLPADLPARKDHFLQRLRADRKALAMLAALLERAAAIDAHLTPFGLGRFFYQPWLLPMAASHEILALKKPPSKNNAKRSSWNILFSFFLEGPGHVEAHIVYKEPEARCRLLLEHPEHADAVLSLMGNPRLGPIRVQVRPPDVSRLAAPGMSPTAGLLANACKTFTGVNLQV